jgi:hypothetical protein
LPTRLALIVATLALTAAVWPEVTAAQSPDAGARKVPMHPSTLTLRGHSRSRVPGNHRYHNHVHNTFNQRTPIHGTMAGPRM